jgi:hypothetical protein
MRNRPVRRLGASLVIAAALASPPVDLLAQQDWRSVTQSRQVGDEELLNVAVQYGAGRLVLGRGSEGMLYKAMLGYDGQAFQPELTYRDGSLRVGMDDVRMRGRNVRLGELRLELGPTVPIDLRLEFGAARADVDLTGLRIRRLRLATGASETRLHVGAPNAEVCEVVDLDVGAAKFDAIGLGNLNAQRLDFNGGIGDVTLDFTGEWESDMAATVRMGLGSLTLRVPRGLGLQVKKGGLLVGFDSQGLIKRGDVFYSENWDDAARKLTVDIEAAFGSIRVQWVDGNHN